MPEKNAIARGEQRRPDGPAARGVQVVGRLSCSRSGQAEPETERAPVERAPALVGQAAPPILLASPRAAAAKERARRHRAGALRRLDPGTAEVVQTLPICGMFGIGTPPMLAAPNCVRIGS